MGKPLPSKNELLLEAYNTLDNTYGQSNDRIEALARKAQALVAIAEALPAEKRQRDRAYSEAAQL